MRKNCARCVSARNGRPRDLLANANTSQVAVKLLQHVHELRRVQRLSGKQHREHIHCQHRLVRWGAMFWSAAKPLDLQAVDAQCQYDAQWRGCFVNLVVSHTPHAHRASRAAIMMMLWKIHRQSARVKPRPARAAPLGSPILACSPAGGCASGMAGQLST